VQRRYGFLRALAVVAGVVLIVVLGVVELASDALNAEAAAPGTLPTRIPQSFGIAVYTMLDRIAPASFVESTLAARALAGGDDGAAEYYARRLPPSATRDELLARVALARGQRDLALEYLLAAPDVDAVQKQVQAMPPQQAERAYALEKALKARLEILRTHPDAVAEASFRMGALANRVAWHQSDGAIRRAWFVRGMADLEYAVALAPLSEKYVLAAANQAMLVGDVDRAQALFAHGVDVDPGSANAVAGLGVAAWKRGDAAAATAYLARARRINPHAGMVRALERDLRSGSRSKK